MPAKPKRFRIKPVAQNFRGMMANKISSFRKVRLKYLLSSTFPVKLELKVEEPSREEPKLIRPVWRVMAWNPTRLVWTVRSTHDNESDAAEHAEALWWSQPKLRVMVTKGTVRVTIFSNPPICNVSKQFREQQAAQMSDLADAKRYYKSPG